MIDGGTESLGQAISQYSKECESINHIA